MSLLIDFFISTPVEVLGYLDHGNYPAVDCHQTSGIGPLEIAGIYSAILGTGTDALELMDDFRLVSPEDADEWIYSVPDEFVEILAECLDTEIVHFANAAAEITAEELSWEASDFESILKALAALSKRAQENDLNMYYWMSV
jgi:hypothetical protein